MTCGENVSLNGFSSMLSWVFIPAFQFFHTEVISSYSRGAFVSFFFFLLIPFCLLLSNISFLFTFMVWK